MTLEECDTDMLLRLLREYEEGIAAIDSGEQNSACGGSRRQCVRWRNAAKRELESRGVTA